MGDDHKGHLRMKDSNTRYGSWLQRQNEMAAVDWQGDKQDKLAEKLRTASICDQLFLPLYKWCCQLSKQTDVIGSK